MPAVIASGGGDDQRLARLRPADLGEAAIGRQALHVEHRAVGGKRDPRPRAELPQLGSGAIGKQNGARGPVRMAFRAADQLVFLAARRGLAAGFSAGGGASPRCEALYAFSISIMATVASR